QAMFLWSLLTMFHVLCIGGLAGVLVSFNISKEAHPVMHSSILDGHIGILVTALYL
ncbi:hypothetical protein ACJX0J_008097, partial [Zea mays]